MTDKGNTEVLPKLLVKYMGSREVQPDRMFKSGVSWNGPGDVQPMPADKALAITRFDPRCFRIVKDENDLGGLGKLPKNAEEASGFDRPTGHLIDEVDGSKVNIEDASRLALVRYAEAIGMQVPHDAKRDFLLDAIKNVEAAARGGMSPTEPSPLAKDLGVAQVPQTDGAKGPGATVQGRDAAAEAAAADMDRAQRTVPEDKPEGEEDGDEGDEGDEKPEGETDAVQQPF